MRVEKRQRGHEKVRAWGWRVKLSGATNGENGAHFTGERAGAEELMAAEELILVDAFDRELGVGEKMQVHRAGALHRAFSVFVFDGRGHLLMQKRAADKYHSAGLWSNTACGPPRPGEATREAARRRLHEGMGLDWELREAFGVPSRA